MAWCMMATPLVPLVLALCMHQMRGLEEEIRGSGWVLIYTMVIGSLLVTRI